MADDHGCSQWKQMSQKELDHCVSPSQWSHRRHLFPDVVEHFIRTIASGTKSVQKCTAHKLDLHYGEDSSQVLDLYLPQNQTEGSPVLIVIHGGYWQASCSKEDFGLCALQPSKEGAVVAVVDYRLAPMATLPQISSDVEKSVVYMATKFPKARGFYVCGHSAGGQLGAMMLSVDWSDKYGLPNDFIRGACLISGVFDVRPLVRSYVNEVLHLTDEVAYQVSPINPTILSEAIRLSPRCKVINVCGEYDPPLYHRMMTEYTRELARGGMDATCEIIPGVDHFELAERLTEAEFSLTQTLLGMMSLPANGDLASEKNSREEF